MRVMKTSRLKALGTPFANQNPMKSHQFLRTAVSRASSS